jgi:hypothetical protein
VAKYRTTAPNIAEPITAIASRKSHHWPCFASRMTDTPVTAISGLSLAVGTLRRHRSRRGQSRQSKTLRPISWAALFVLSHSMCQNLRSPSVTTVTFCSFTAPNKPIDSTVMHVTDVSSKMNTLTLSEAQLSRWVVGQALMIRRAWRSFAHLHPNC